MLRRERDEMWRRGGYKSQIEMDQVIPSRYPVNVTFAFASKNIPSNSVLAGPSPVTTKCTSRLLFQIPKYALARHLNFFSQLTRPTYNKTIFPSAPQLTLRLLHLFSGENNSVSTPRCQIRIVSGNPWSRSVNRVLGLGHMIAEHWPCRYR